MISDTCYDAIVSILECFFAMTLTEILTIKFLLIFETFLTVSCVIIVHFPI